MHQDARTATKLVSNKISTNSGQKQEKPFFFRWQSLWGCDQRVNLIKFDFLIPSHVSVSFLEIASTFSQSMESVSENTRFSVADSGTLFDKSRLSSKIVLIFNADKRTLRSTI